MLTIIMLFLMLSFPRELSGGEVFLLYLMITENLALANWVMELLAYFGETLGMI